MKKIILLFASMFVMANSVYAKTIKIKNVDDKDIYVKVINGAASRGYKLDKGEIKEISTLIGLLSIKTDLADTGEIEIRRSGYEDSIAPWTTYEYNIGSRGTMSIEVESNTNTSTRKTAKISAIDGGTKKCISNCE